MSSYAYANNQPTGIVDPSGMRGGEGYQCMARDGSRAGSADINSVDANGNCDAMFTRNVCQGWQPVCDHKDAIIDAIIGISVTSICTILTGPRRTEVPWRGSTNEDVIRAIWPLLKAASRAGWVDVGRGVVVVRRQLPGPAPGT
jgi:hypothetical protein